MSRETVKEQIHITNQNISNSNVNIKKTNHIEVSNVEYFEYN